jgi:hypothetical protein
MGVDCFGRNPATPEGRYLGCNWAAWRALIDLVRVFAPSESASCRSWYTNDGYGLDQAGALLLALRLEGQIASGAVKNHCDARDAKLASLRDQCGLCNGTGWLALPGPPIGRVPCGCDGGCPFCDGTGWTDLQGPSTERVPRVGCDGAGEVPASGAYPRVEDIEEFARFVRQSGGFEIW